MQDIETQSKLLGLSVFHVVDLANLFRTTAHMHMRCTYMYEYASENAEVIFKQQAEHGQFTLVSSVLWAAQRVYQNVDPIYDALETRGGHVIQKMAKEARRDLVSTEVMTAFSMKNVRDVEDVANICACLVKQRRIQEKLGKAGIAHVKAKVSAG